MEAVTGVRGRPRRWLPVGFAQGHPSRWGRRVWDCCTCGRVRSPAEDLTWRAEELELVTGRKEPLRIRSKIRRWSRSSEDESVAVPRAQGEDVSAAGPLPRRSEGVPVFPLGPRQLPPLPESSKPLPAPEEASVAQGTDETFVGLQRSEKTGTTG